jgi:Tfp pilus assembly protein FimV
MLVAALLAPVVLTAPAAGQSDADLRKQNQELQSRVKDLEAELAAAKTQSEALQKRIDALESALTAARSGAASATATAASPPEEKVSIDESVPGASPRALFNAVAESYRKAVADAPIGRLGDRDRVAYMRKVEKWKGLAEREFRMPIEWHVLLLPPRMVDNTRERIATFVAVDPVTGTRLGDAFDVQLSRAMAARIAALDTGEDIGPLQLKGTAITRVRINEQRESAGTFDSPRFIGPFAEYEFTVEPTSVVTVKPAQATQPAASTRDPAR